ncbi:MAG: GNAT family N-acetyltransferase [Desulfuromonadales bacterium]|nr:GNAT family N-acetyltransferase [Desulfuromonadales bacterium]
MLIIRSLDASHDRKRFDCGVPALNEFLQKTARQHKEKGLSNTFVLSDEDTPHLILGYFTLSFLEIDAGSLPVKYSRTLPKLARLPGAKLARLAVDTSSQGKGYGELLLADAVKRVLATTQESGAITGFFVDAKNESIKNFYIRFGFIPLRDEPLKVFLPLSALVKGLDKAIME